SASVLGFSGTQQITGTGTLTAPIGEGGGTLTIGAGIVIQGGGASAAGTGNIVNLGVLQPGSGNGYSEIDGSKSGTAGIYNDGVIVATAGPLVETRGNFHNRSGVLRAAPGGILRFGDGSSGEPTWKTSELGQLDNTGGAFQFSGNVDNS